MMKPAIAIGLCLVLSCGQQVLGSNDDDTGKQKTETPPPAPAPNPTQDPPKPQPMMMVAFAPGMIMPFAGNVPPDGWWICDGKAVSRDMYPDLFKAIGSAWGNGDDGDGPLFNIPDLRGVFLRGVDSGAMRDPEAKMRTAYRQGGNIGDSVGSYQNAGTAPPKVPFSSNLTTYSTSIDEGNDFSSKVASAPYTAQMMLTGGDKETRPLNVAVHYLIKY